MIDGTNNYQQLYQWSQNKIVIIHQSFDIENEKWNNGVKTISVLDGCGQTTILIRQHFIEDSWINYYKRKYFKSFAVAPQLQKHVKIPVCHEGHTIYIPYQALKAHLDHGDCIGVCFDFDNVNPHSGNKKSVVIEPESYSSQNQISVSPNPSIDKTTIKLPRDHDFTRIMIFDIYGRIIKNIHAQNKRDIVLFNNDYEKGVYILRFTGDKISETKKVIFR